MVDVTGGISNGGCTRGGCGMRLVVGRRFRSCYLGAFRIAGKVE